MKRQLILAVMMFMLLALNACAGQPSPAATEVPKAYPTNVEAPAYPAPAEPGLAYPYPIQPAYPAGDMQAMPQPYMPAAEDANMSRGEAFIDSVEVLAQNGGPLKLAMAGNLPTPCHQLRVEVTPPDAQNKITVSVYSVAPSGENCTQVLAPFQAEVALPTIGAGKYSVVVNDQPAVEFQVP